MANNAVRRTDLLSTGDMARFVARGFLRFDGLIPDEINRDFLERVMQDDVRSHPPGTPLADCYATCPPISALLQLPKVAGMIQSLV
ncbi:MAG: phytanoyl-CoA dioxygenase, partial [SAR86 cluster bacterium]|nr:phytanoyl-CoA dioxygenase [SAR86 cluster bacterium]